MTAKELIKAGIAESVTDKSIEAENNPVIETKISEKPKKAIKR
jgi:hypothetical protein